MVTDGPLRTFTDPKEFGGTMIYGHKVAGGAFTWKQWETFRASCAARLDTCYQKKKGDLAKLQRIT